MGGAILAGLLAPGRRGRGRRPRDQPHRGEGRPLAPRRRHRRSPPRPTPTPTRRRWRAPASCSSGVKPHMVADLLREIAPALEPGAVVVSVAAGVTTATMEAALPASRAPCCARCRTRPSHVGRGVTGLAAGIALDATPTSRSPARSSRLVGDVVVVPEEQIDALSTISGSGPAYVFFLIEQLTGRRRSPWASRPTQAATHGAGHVPRRQRAARPRRPATPTPAELRRRVTSPERHDRAGRRRARGGAASPTSSTGRTAPPWPATARSPRALSARRRAGARPQARSRRRAGACARQPSSAANFSMVRLLARHDDEVVVGDDRLRRSRR